jgi:hypothetical protein
MYFPSRGRKENGLDDDIGKQWSTVNTGSGLLFVYWMLDTPWWCTPAGSGIEVPGCRTHCEQLVLRHCPVPSQASWG